MCLVRLLHALTFSPFNLSLLLGGSFPPSPVQREQLIGIFAQGVKLKVWVIKMLSAGLFSKQSRNTDQGALKNHTGCVEQPKIWNHEGDSSSLYILTVPQRVLWQQRHTKTNNLSVAAPFRLLPQEGGDSDSAKITAADTPFTRPLKPGESLSLAYTLVCSLFLLEAEGHFFLLSSEGVD